MAERKKKRIGIAADSLGFVCRIGKLLSSLMLIFLHEHFFCAVQICCRPLVVS
jgi:hypothetical protein